MYTGTKELLEVVRFKTCNYVYWFTRADLHFDEIIFSIRNYICFEASNINLTIQRVKLNS